ACYNGEADSWRALSPMYMDTCVMPQWDMGECLGAATEYGMSQINFEGIPTASCFPYAYSGDGTSHFDTTSNKIYTCDEIKETHEELKADGKCPTAEQYFLQATPRTSERDKRYFPKYVTSRNIDTLTLSPTNKERIVELLKAQGPLNARMDVYASFMDAAVEAEYSNPVHAYDHAKIGKNDYPE
ncbi:hypothetical protein CYMTET_34259, partial [Cymbomonas tetramitiformis]